MRNNCEGCPRPYETLMSVTDKLSGSSLIDGQRMYLERNALGVCCALDGDGKVHVTIRKMLTCSQKASWSQGE